PREVSGGMAQRASLARALARSPQVLLLDEPFGALDALTRLRMQDLLLQIHAAEPTTVLVVTHDVDEALYLADRVLLLRSLPEADAASGAPTATAGTAGPAGTGSIARTLEVPGARPRDRADHTLAQLRADLLEGLGVRPHHPAPPPRTPPTPHATPPRPPARRGPPGPVPSPAPSNGPAPGPATAPTTPWPSCAPTCSRASASAPTTRPPPPARPPPPRRPPHDPHADPPHRHHARTDG